MTQCCACKRFGGTTYAPTPADMKMSGCDARYEYQLRYKPKPRTVSLVKQQKMLDTTSAADWESAIHDAIEAVTGLDVCDADDNIYSAVGGNCALNCNLKYGAAAGTCTTLKSGDAAWKDKYGDRAVEAVGWADAQLINAGYTACQYAPEAGAKMYLPTARPTFAAPTRVPTSKPTVLGHRDANASYAPTYKPTHQRTGIPTAEPTPSPSTAVPSVAPTFETWAPSEVPTPVPVPKPTH